MQNVKFRDEVLTLKNSIKLKSRIWRPSQGNGPWPALLMRQPYGREIASTVTYPHPSWFASNDFLVVIQDVRGQGGSEGEFCGFEQEAADTTQTHSWVRSLPECNGKLGTYGFSYQGLTQLLGDPNSQPPDCLAPAMTGLDEFSHWSCDGNAFWWHIGISWGLQLAALKARRENNEKVWIHIRECLENSSYLSNGPELLQKYDPKGMVYKWLNNSTNIKKQAWQVHNPLNSWLKQPMFLIGGWWDPHLKGIIDIYERSLKAGGKPELHIGPGKHLEWWENIHEAQLNFFKMHLQRPNQLIENKKGIESQQKKMLWNLTTNNWVQTKRRNRFDKWSLSSKGLACFSEKDGQIIPNKKGEGFLSIVHDPWRPVPSVGGHLSPQPGPANRNEIDKRGDVAIFTSDPLTHSLYIEGTPTLKLSADADQESFDLCIALSTIDRDLKSVNQLSTGFLRLSSSREGKSLLRKIILQPILAEIKEGDQLRISIAGSSWPAIGINPGRDGMLAQAPTPHCLITTISLDLEESIFDVEPLFSK